MSRSKRLQCECGGDVEKRSSFGPLKCMSCGKIAAYKKGGFVIVLQSATEAIASQKLGTLAWIEPTGFWADK